MSLRSVNLNLIPVLQALLRHQNVSRAAAAVHLSQPTVSIALARLREILGDPLLLPVGRRMELTPRARQLIGPVEAACAALQTVLQAPAFDPGSAVRCFSIATVDHLPGQIGPTLVAALARRAPGVTVHFINSSRETITQHRLGEVDLLILPAGVAGLLGYPEMRTTRLYREEFVSVVGPFHPLAGCRDAAAFECAGYPHAVFSPGIAIPEGFGDAYGMAGPAPAPAAPQPPIVARFEHFSALPMMAAEAGLVAIVPRRLALQMQPYLALTIVGRPLPPIEICLAWSPMLDSDPAHAWFRTLLVETSGDQATAGQTGTRPASADGH